MNSKGPQIGMPWGDGDAPRRRRRGKVWHFGDSDKAPDPSSRSDLPEQVELLEPRRVFSVRPDSIRPVPIEAGPRQAGPRQAGADLSQLRTAPKGHAESTPRPSPNDAPSAHVLEQFEEALEHRKRMGALAERVPAHVRMGTVGYRYPQWGALIFDRPSPAEIAERGLSDYTSQPLFGAIGLPSHELVPNERELLWELLELPEGYTPVVMMNPGLTTPLFPRRKLLDAANGEPSDAGHFNPSFLDPRLFRDEVFPALEELRSVCEGELVVALTLPPLLRESGVPPYPFLWRLERLATVVPDGIRIAVELREPDYVTDDYLAFLSEAGWAHVVSTWPGMPAIDDQWHYGTADGPRIVRLASPRPRTPPLGYAPGVALHRPQQDIRQSLAQALLQDDRETVVLASNAFEGCAPLSLEALAQALPEIPSA